MGAPASRRVKQPPRGWKKGGGFDLAVKKLSTSTFFFEKQYFNNCISFYLDSNFFLRTSNFSVIPNVKHTMKH